MRWGGRHEDFSVKRKPRLKGKTAALVDAFVEDAKENGHDMELRKTENFYDIISWILLL